MALVTNMRYEINPSQTVSPLLFAFLGQNSGQYWSLFIDHIVLLIFNGNYSLVIVDSIGPCSVATYSVFIVIGHYALCLSDYW